MLKSNVLLGCALGVLLTACVTEPTNVNLNPSGGNTGGDGTGGDGTGNSGTGNSGTGAGGNVEGAAYDYFISDVFPAIDGPCGSCHATGDVGAPIFMAASADASYNAMEGAGLIAIPANSVLIQHGVHTGPALTPNEQTIVETWLNMEADERGLAGGGGGDDPPAGTTLTQALEDFADCMNIDVWDATGMNNLHNADTGNAGECDGCHSAGDGGAWLSANDVETFEMNREFPYIKRLVTGTVDENGQFAGLIPALRYIQKGQTECGENQNCHPAYSLPPGLESAVLDFVDLTLEAMENGTCDQPPPAQ